MQVIVTTMKYAAIAERGAWWCDLYRLHTLLPKKKNIGDDFPLGKEKGSGNVGAPFEMLLKLKTWLGEGVNKRGLVGVLSDRPRQSATIKNLYYQPKLSISLFKIWLMQKKRSTDYQFSWRKIFHLICHRYLVHQFSVREEKTWIIIFNFATKKNYLTKDCAVEF